MNFQDSTDTIFAIEAARDPSLDILRVLATYMVIVVHVAAMGAYDIKAYGWQAVNVWDSLMRPCVPLFLMLSGALLLHRPNTITDVRKRVVVLLISLIFWSAAYMAWFSLTTPNRLQPPDLWSARLPVLTEPVVFHFWYLYTLIGLYVMLPVLRAGFQSTRNVRVFIVSVFAVASLALPSLSVVFGFRVLGVDTRFFYWPAAYVLLGAVLVHARPNLAQASFALGVFVVVGLGTAYLTSRATLSSGRLVETYYSYYSFLVAIGAVTVFIAVRGFASGAMQQNSVFWLRNAAGTSFGVYILHMVVIYYLTEAGLSYSWIHPAIGVPVVSLLVLILSACAVALLQTIPGSRYVIPR